MMMGMYCKAVLSLLLFLVSPVLLTAQQIVDTNTIYEGMDLLFLVDQSGSMSGRDGASQPTDPLGLRFESVQFVLDTLGDYRRIVPDDLVFRMSVVSFGDQSEITLPWTSIGGTDWETQETLFTDQISASNFGDRSLGNTDFVGAFEQAQMLFSSLPANENHLRVIVVVTDGAPCAPARFEDIYCNRVSDQNQHMDQVIALTSATFPPPNHRIFTIAIDSDNSYWPRFDNYWQRVVNGSNNNGQATRIEASTDIGPLFLEILTQIVADLRGVDQDNAGNVIGQQIIANGQQQTVISVAPYRQLLRVTAFKTEPVAGLSVFGPDGQSLSAGNINVNVTGATSNIEVWTITDPRPGNWQFITGDTGQLVVYLDLIQVRWQFDTLIDNPTRAVSVPFSLSLLDSEGNLLPAYSDPDYALDVQATLTTPSGQNEQLTLQTDGMGLFRGEFTPLETGHHSLDLLGVTQDVDGSTLVIIDESNAASFEVNDIELSATISPQGDLLTSEAVTITAQLLLPDGTPVNPADIIMDANYTTGEGVNSLRMQETEDGTHRIEVVLDDRGQYQITVAAMIEVTNGSILIDEVVLPSFRVEPADYVLLQITTPRDEDQQFTTDGMPPINPVDIVIEVEVTNEDGERLDLAALADGELPISLRVNNENGDNIADEFGLVATDVVGQYRAVIPSPDTGTYEIIVEGDSNVRLAQSTLFDPRVRIQRATITRVTNPGYIATFVTASVFAVMITGSTIFFAVRQIRKRQHPARGQLAILEENLQQYSQPTIIWRESLDRYHSNYIQLKNLPHNISRIVVECNSDAMSNRGHVMVTVYRNRRKIVPRASMGPGTTRNLDELSNEDTILMLVKDPEETFDV